MSVRVTFFGFLIFSTKYGAIKVSPTSLSFKVARLLHVLPKFSVKCTKLQGNGIPKKPLRRELICGILLISLTKSFPSSFAVDTKVMT